jgi:hypothetical protein
VAYWIIPTLEAVGLIKYEQIRTRDVEGYKGRWDLSANRRSHPAGGYEHPLPSTTRSRP